ncbi:6461_t:CDS:10 [Racocetra fulgida]|uniref:6461_t:CDS:1 n=1 Tax=Racocetra fulgida TaxID=60492 RepID=A0A9N9G2E1_9GLOM|nr:6461_t:CDS:10 [Racocetra fulgida]
MRAVEYLNDVFDQVPNFDELLQLSVIELIRKDYIGCYQGKYIRCIFELLNAASHSVKYEAATSLMALTHAPAAVKAAASCYIELIIKESDNNIKLIVLDRLDELREKHEQTLDDLVVEKFPNLRSSITEKLLETFMDVKSGKVFRGALWIVGEYCTECQDIEEAWKQIRAGLGEIPILASEQRLLEEAEKEEKGEDSVSDNKSANTSSSRRILADGTYATESIFSSNSLNSAKLDAVKAAAKPPLRCRYDFFLGSVLAATLTKLVLRYAGVSKDVKKTNALRAEVKVGQSQFVSTPIDEDSYDRIMSCLHVLEQLSIDASIKSAFLQDTKAAFARIVEAEEKRTAAKKAKDKSVAAVQVDDLISFRQFSKRNLGDEADENLSIEFATLGDLKLVERPTQHNLAPHSFHSVKATIKTGVIFGNIVYDGPGTSESNCVVLNDIHIDIMDYINPAVEKQTDGAITGHVRIRSKTQGIALSLGDKITLGMSASHLIS